MVLTLGPNGAVVELLPRPLLYARSLRRVDVRLFAVFFSGLGIQKAHRSGGTSNVKY